VAGKSNKWMKQSDAEGLFNAESIIIAEQQMSKLTFS
jgi:hypothetical protein